MPDSQHPPMHPSDLACRRNLRLLREHRGWSLPRAGRNLGIKPSTLASYERHEKQSTIRQITVEQARRLAAGYGVSLADLLDPSAILMLTRGLRPSLAVDEPAVEQQPVQVIDLVGALQSAVERAHAARHAGPAAVL